MASLEQVYSEQTYLGKHLGNCKEEFMAMIKDKPDMVNHPPHYKKTTRECIDIIQDSLTSEEFIGYLKGTIIKYTYRYPDKSGQEDMDKAIWFINKLKLQEESDETDTTE